MGNNNLLDYNYYANIITRILKNYQRWEKTETKRNVLDILGFGKRNTVKPLLFQIEEIFPEISPNPQINACSFYGYTEDKICIYRYLARFIANMMSDCAKSQEECSWLFFCALLFCSFHEFAHLHLGHIQLISSRSFAMSYPDWDKEIYKHRMSLDMQTMEIEADALAAQLLGNYVSGQIKNNGYRKFIGYKSVDRFYRDSVKAICGFFSIIRYLEYKEQLSKYKRNDKEPYTHPSYLLRLFYTGFYFMEYIKQATGIPYKSSDFEYYVVNMMEIFSHCHLSEKYKKEEYDEIYSSEFIKGLKLVYFFPIRYALIKSKIQPSFMRYCHINATISYKIL